MFSPPLSWYIMGLPVFLKIDSNLLVGTGAGSMSMMPQNAPYIDRSLCFGIESVCKFTSGTWLFNSMSCFLGRSERETGPSPEKSSCPLPNRTAHTLSLWKERGTVSGKCCWCRPRDESVEQGCFRGYVMAGVCWSTPANNVFNEANSGKVARYFRHYS